MLSPEMISDPPLYFRAVPYAMSGITAVAGRARHLPTPPEEEEERGQGGTVPAVPCALRGGQPSVAAPPRHRLFLTTVSVCVCSRGRVRLPWEAAPSPE